jgi:hypothetical protein
VHVDKTPKAHQRVYDNAKTRYKHFKRHPTAIWKRPLCTVTSLEALKAMCWFKDRHVVDAVMAIQMEFLESVHKDIQATRDKRVSQIDFDAFVKEQFPQIRRTLDMVRAPTQGPRPSPPPRRPPRRQAPPLQ